MRWIWAETEAEKVEGKSVLERIDAWWTAFSDKEEEITAGFSADGPEWDLPGWMQETLQAIHPALMWEYGPALEGDGHRLVVTPEQEYRLRPLVNSILDQAPKLSGWEFYGHRMPNPYERALGMVQARSGQDIADWRVLTSISGTQVSLTYFSPNCTSRDDENAFSTAFVATESLLGEECFSKWISVVEVVPSMTRGFFGLGKKETIPGIAIPLSELRERVDTLVKGLLSELPEQPYFKEWADSELLDADGELRDPDSALGWLYQLEPSEPDESDDYPGFSDMFVGKATIPEFFDAVRYPYFSSDCFSRCGETFCYVKLDGKDGIEGEKFADKSEIEDALDERLLAEECGCFIGGGSGLRYSYVDLALSDLHRGIEIVRETLRAGNVPKRSWILFFDTEMAAEWIGIYPDSPAPPTEISH